MEDQPLNSLNVAGFAVFTRLDERNKPILCPREEANPGTGWMPDGYERIYRGPTLSVARAAALAAADRIVSEDEDRRLGVTISETALPNGEGVVLVHVEDEEYQDDPGRSVFDAFQEEFGFGAFRPARLDVEIALLADRADVTEECVRLRSHLAQTRDALTADEPVGRRLGFLAQEIHREINTIGSKANDAETARLSVAMKETLEKIREQINNVL